MAIVSNYNAESFGLSTALGYTKISTFYVLNEGVKKTLFITTQSFYDTNARFGGKLPIGTNNFSLEVEDENFTFEFMYTYIKTFTDIFPNAVDAI